MASLRKDPCRRILTALYVIVSANIPTVLLTPSTVSPAAPAVPALPPRVLSTANSASGPIMGSPGDSAVPVPLKNSAEASCPT